MVVYDLLELYTESTFRFIQYLKGTFILPYSYLFRLHSFGNWAHESFTATYAIVCMVSSHQRADAAAPEQD